MKKLNKKIIVAISVLLAIFLTATGAIYATGQTWRTIFDRTRDLVSGEDWDNLLKETEENNPNLIYPGLDELLTVRNNTNITKAKWYAMYTYASTMTHTDSRIVNLNNREASFLTDEKSYIKHISIGLDADQQGTYLIVQYFTNIIDVKSYDSSNSSLTGDKKAVAVAFGKIYHYEIHKTGKDSYLIKQGEFIGLGTTGTYKDSVSGEITTQVSPNNGTYLSFTGANGYITETPINGEWYIPVRDNGLSKFPDIGYINYTNILAWWIEYA